MSEAKEVRLAPRQLQILGMVAAGRPTKAIAAELFMSDSTVKTHLRNAYVLLGARNAAQAVAIAYRTGLLGGEPQ